MTLFEAGEGYTLYHGDVLEVLEKIPDNSVDMIFADPPYNLSNGGFTCRGGQRVSVDKGEWDKSHGATHDFEFHRSWISACRRVLKDNGTIWISGTYHSIYQCGYALQLDGWHILNDIAWYKPNAPPNLSCRMFTASHETLIWARKDKSSRHQFNYTDMKQGDFPKDTLKNPGKQMRSVWSIAATPKSEKQFGKHPTQKPEALLERIILASTNAGDIILDPFCGSATTGAVALKLGRKFIGIDSDKHYLEKIAKRRLKKISQELK